jgi:hypothetical protein
MRQILGFRWKIAGRYGTNKVLALVVAVAKRLVPGMAASTQDSKGTSTEAERLAILIDNLEIPLNAYRAIIENGDSCNCHRFSSVVSTGNRSADSLQT